MPLFYVYTLTSQTNPKRHYTGFTQNLRTRLKTHNDGQCSHTAGFSPWHLETAHLFNDEGKARAFEKYLKTGSGRAFARQHF